MHINHRMLSEESFALMLESRVTTYDARSRSGRFEENHYPPTTSAVNITIVPRGRTIVIGDPLPILRCLSRASRESSEFPPPTRGWFSDVCPRDKYAGCATRRPAIDTHPLLEQPYITARSRICIYASRIISQLSITSSRLFAGNNGSLLACCSLCRCLCVSPSPLSLSPRLRSCSTLSSSPLSRYRRICLRETPHTLIDRYTLMPLLRDNRVYISWKRNSIWARRVAWL